MALQTISQRIALEGVENIIRLLQGMGEAGEKAVAQIHAATSAAKSPLADFSHGIEEGQHAIGGFVDGLQKLEQAAGPALSRVNRFTRDFDELRGVIGALAPAMAEFAGVTLAVAFVTAAHSAASATRELVNASKELGVTVEKLEALKYAAASVGIGSEEFDRRMARFVARLGEAQRASEEFAESQAERAQQAVINEEKENLALDKGRQALERNAAEMRNLNLERDRAAVGMQKLGLATKEAQVEQGKYDAATAKLNGTHRTTLQNLQGQVSGTKALVAVEEAAISLKGKLNSINEKSTALAHERSNILKEEKIRTEELAQTEEKAARQAEKTKDEFSRLGIALRDGSGAWKTADVVLKELADKIKNNANAAENAATLLKLFGRGWADILPLLHLGKDGIEKLEEEFRKLGISLTEAEISMGQKFNESWAKMMSVMESIKNIFGDLISQFIVPFSDALKDVFVAATPGMRAFVGALADVLVPVIRAAFNTVKVFATALAGIFGGVYQQVEKLAQALNKVAGTDFTGADLVVSLGLLYLTLGKVTSAVGLMFAAVTKIITVVYEFAKAIRVMNAGLTITETLMQAAMINPLGLILIGIGLIAAAILIWPETFGKVFGSVVKGFDWVIEKAKELLRYLHLINQETPAAPAGPPTADQGGRGGASQETPLSDIDPATHQRREDIGRASGGWIPGSGSGDHVPVMAEPGEFVVRRTMASRFGSFLSALNAGMVQGRAMGGIVDALNSGPSPIALPAGPGGGSSGEDRVAFHLTIDGNTFRGLTAPAAVADNLLQHARTSAILSAGVKPSWKR